jgi:hypothetical protein
MVTSFQHRIILYKVRLTIFSVEIVNTSDGDPGEGKHTVTTHTIKSFSPRQQVDG